MIALVFADNTVLVGFGHLGRLDLLGALVRDNGRWTHTVARECQLSSRVAGLESLVTAGEIFGEPLYPTRIERSDAEAIRRSMASPGDPSAKHLGEAETIAIIESRRERSYFVSDDHAALDEAARRGLPTLSTGELLKLAVKVKLMTAEEAWEAVVTLRHVPHHVARVPLGHHEFMTWCSS